MGRYRMYPSEAQEQQLLEHCSHARFVWNLAVEQQSWWKVTRLSRPESLYRQLAEARAEHEWLRAGSSVVQQQALRDFEQAMRNFFAGTHCKPTWRKKDRHEGFRIVNARPEHVRRLNRKRAQVFVPKVGWVDFRWSRPVGEAKSFRVKRDPAGRWFVAFATVPAPIAGPGTGEVVGIDRGVSLTLALSDGSTYDAPRPVDVQRAARKLSRAKRGSNRRKRARMALATLHTRNADRRKDWAEKASTEIASRYDVIRIEDLKVRNMVRSAKGTIENPGRNVRAKAGLNRSILQQGWSLFAQRLEDKAPGRVEKVNPAYTSQRCSACGHTAAESRKSQALFECVACNFACNADVNAARNIAAGHAARGGLESFEPLNREPLVA